MSAAELRKAAETLRERAGAATPSADWVRDYFQPNSGSLHIRYAKHIYASVGTSQCQADVDYIATMHPAVGLVLADWLEQCAHRLEKGHHTGSRHSHRIARLINGEVSA